MLNAKPYVGERTSRLTVSEAHSQAACQPTTKSRLIRNPVNPNRHILQVK